MRKKNKTLSENTADKLLSMIGQGRLYEPGAKIPNENELSAKLGVSRSTLREAIRMLTAGGVLEIKRGLGTFITDTPSLNFDGIKNIKKSARSIYEAFELRLMFEPNCAGMAAERATDDEIKHIIKYGEELIVLIRKGKSSKEADKRFHESIASATHNSYIEQLLPVVFEGIENSIDLMGKNTLFKEQTISDTQAIMEFLKERSVEGAFTAMKLHILHAMKLIKQY